MRLSIRTPSPAGGLSTVEVVERGYIEIREGGILHAFDEDPMTGMRRRHRLWGPGLWHSVEELVPDCNCARNYEWDPTRHLILCPYGEKELSRVTADDHETGLNEAKQFLADNEKETPK